MTVETLRNILGILPPNKEVLIQQGEAADYVVAYSVKELELVDVNKINEDEKINGVVIDFK